MNLDRNNIPPRRGRLWSRFGLCPVNGLLEGIYIEWQDDCFTRVDVCSRPSTGLDAGEIFPDHLLLPGLLNAHCHLDYSFLQGLLPRDTGFAGWLRKMIRLRKMKPTADKIIEHHQKSRLDAARSGTSGLWDIVSDILPDDSPLAAKIGTYGIRFHEWICPDRDRIASNWGRFRESRFGNEYPGGSLEKDVISAWGSHGEALSVHSVYSVCEDAMLCASSWAQKNSVPVAIHLAESPEEIEMMMTGSGELLDLLKEVSPEKEFGFTQWGRSPVQRAGDAGLLNGSTLAIHCNLPQGGDVDRLARSGAVVVFCPRSHAFFDYPKYPLHEYRVNKVRLALGTDSLASNDSLSMIDELRVFDRLAVDMPPMQRLGIATGAGLGDHPPWGCRGRLERGCQSNWAIWPFHWKVEQCGADDIYSKWLETADVCHLSSAGHLWP